ncbi:adenylosuccinate synthetase [Lentzea kentuckyensis]|uniref:adenylosuccinate synthetase n=1 Tax=Lentzea kentuckyensis TaxID=360086 RepID=UPI001FE74530|nr:adenylosuccinate synthetase [Lentzea kentuckyensis]
MLLRPEVVVVGCLPGLPGTAAVTEMLSAGADAVVRAPDGPGSARVSTQVPGGGNGATGVLGDGCAVDPALLLAEIEARRRTGVALAVSEHAPVIMPYHRVQDAQVQRWAELPATGPLAGAGPCHEDRIAGIGLRMGDLLDPGVLRARLNRLVPLKLALLERLYGWVPNGQRALFDVDVLVDSYRDYGQRLEPHLTDVPDFLTAVRARGGRIVHEACGPDGWAAAALGAMSPDLVSVVGVTPACTSVTAGRVEGLDLTRLRRTVRHARVDWLCVTGVDVLAGLGDIPVATEQGYLPGWPVVDWAEVARVGDSALPAAARRYGEYVANVVGVRLGGLSVGHRPEDTILLDAIPNL